MNLHATKASSFAQRVDESWLFVMFCVFLQQGREKKVLVVVGQCAKAGQLFNTTNTVFSSNVIQVLLDEPTGSFVATNWIPLCKGMSRTSFSQSGLF